MFSLFVFCTDRYGKCRHVTLSAKSWKPWTCYNFLVSYRAPCSMFKKFWVSSLKKVFINVCVLKLCYNLLAKNVTDYCLWVLLFFFFPVILPLPTISLVTYWFILSCADLFRLANLSDDNLSNISFFPPNSWLQLNYCWLSKHEQFFALPLDVNFEFCFISVCHPPHIFLLYTCLVLFWSHYYNIVQYRLPFSFSLEWIESFSKWIQIDQARISSRIVCFSLF